MVAWVNANSPGRSSEGAGVGKVVCPNREKVQETKNPKIRKRLVTIFMYKGGFVGVKIGNRPIVKCKNGK